MALLPIIETPDPRLKAISAPVEKVDDDLRVFIADMFETMYDAPGIGLAAIQVGLAKRVLVIDLQDKDEETGETIKDPRVFINPEILEESEELSVYSEGCLSVPGIFVPVERAQRVRVRAQDRHGATFERDLDGILAVCLQHEMDHLDGKLFVDYLSSLKRDRIRRKLEKERRERGPQSAAAKVPAGAALAP